MASSSSSSSADLLVESSSSSEEGGFSFNGQTFATYQEMVEAKRARNRKVLDKSVGEIASALGSNFKGSKMSPLNSSINNSSKKRERRGSNQGNSVSVQRPLRRNPGRAARGTTSSLSSQSHISSSCKSTKKKRRRIAPAGGSIMSSLCETDGNTSNSAAGASVCSTSPSLPTSVNLKQNHNIHKPSFFASNGTMSHAENEVPAEVSAAMPDHSLSPKSIMIKDMSASLEHILLNGGRVQARETGWRDFVLSDPILSGDCRDKTPFTNKRDTSKRKCDGLGDEKNIRGRENDGLVHLSDWKLYHHITAQSCDPLYNSGNGDDDRAKNDFVDDDDDIVIPDEYLATSEPKSKAEAASNCSQEQQRHSKMLQETLPLDNPVKYNNMIRERHTVYTSRGLDRHWDEEFGDGVDPMLFVEECCKRSGNATATAGNGIGSNNDDCESKDGIERSRFKCGIDAPSFIAKSYTSSLLQRCWDRAVHAASNTITVTPTAGNQRGLKPTLGANPKAEEHDASVLQNQTVVESVLHREAMDVVDAILDTLFLDGSENPLRHIMLDGSHTANQQTGLGDWRHVLKCLQAAVTRQENNMKRNKSPSGFSSQVNGKRCPILLNHISLKLITMRLVERYGTKTHRL
eukprot:CAMPEP_0181113188 /NCGR_PEP_ID=MMETSP1071-20121207/20215_1 /TAXON_ID=35127 /ORGANISM="Thalassiosira sp., Strain NH16" /LENGTH=631 /DNA_ID=CAMNT_0023197211 /DNA_START=193 /DNA_END=2088 /DNA_ORIENTATION=-